MLSSTEVEKPNPKRRQTIFAEPEIMSQVDLVAKELHFNTRTKTLQFLAKFYEQSQHGPETIPIATFEQIMSIDAPVCLFGIPGSGKSFTLDQFLKECRRRNIPFLLFNSDNRDHTWIEKQINYGDVVGLHWLDEPAQYIVKLESNLAMRKTIINQIAQSILMLEGNAKLERWVLAFEEAHDYHRIEAFNSILRRMRKSVRKLVVISTEAELFKMCRAMRPIPFEACTQTSR